MPLNITKRATMLAASAAAFAMAAQPASAAQMPQAGPAELSNAATYSIATTYSGQSETAHQYRRYDRYDRRGRYRRNRGVGAGDVIAGVLVLGAIAAIAGGNKSNRNRVRDRSRDRDYDRDYSRNPRNSRNDNRDRRSSDGYQSNGLNNAVDMCADQVERGEDRIANVDNAARTANGWSVSGSLENGSRFDCQIDNEGRIRNVDLGGGLSSYGGSNASGSYSAAEVGPQGTQHSDDVYARARRVTQGANGGYVPANSAAPTYSQRASNDGNSNVDADIYANDPRPAYPGGPLPGEAGYDEALGG